jgi:cytoskeletal protein CcmA (bactofilin family)
MDSTPSATPKDNSNQTPQAEELKPRDDSTAVQAAAAAQAAPKKPLKHHTYRPSHKATFIGLAVVVAILAVNAAVIELVLKKQAKTDNLATKGQVSISSEQLSKLGIDRNSIGDTGVQLVVAPDAQFKGKLTVAGDTTVSGKLLLNSTLTTTSANITQLQAGNTSLAKLDVNGDTNLSGLNLRKDLLVTGNTQLQGPVTLKQLLTVNNSVNIQGNLSVGGTFTASVFSARSLTSTSTLTIGGHIITSGLNPSFAPGGAALGSNGTASVSGNDSAGAININIGVGASGGILGTVAFRTNYSNAPRVVITPVGVGANFYVTNLTVGGFSVGVTAGLPAGGYRINYIVEQ